MSAISSATKDCPQCRALLAGDATTCACGHRFEHNERPTSTLLTQAEELFETHLRARHQRALRALKLAKVDLLRDPGSAVRKAQLRELEKDAQQLELQLATQVARVAEVRAAAEQTPVELSSTPTTDTEETFKALQAAKALRAFEVNRLGTAIEEHQGSVSGAFIAAQAEKASHTERAAATPQTCPGCGNHLAAGIAHCACGYRLGQDASADFISVEEFAALRVAL